MRILSLPYVYLQLRRRRRPRTSIAALFLRLSRSCCRHARTFQCPCPTTSNEEPPSTDEHCCKEASTPIARQFLQNCKKLSGYPDNKKKPDNFLTTSRQFFFNVRNAHFHIKRRQNTPPVIWGLRGWSGQCLKIIYSSQSFIQDPLAAPRPDRQMARVMWFAKLDHFGHHPKKVSVR